MRWDPDLGGGGIAGGWNASNGGKRKLVLQVLEKLHTGPSSPYWSELPPLE